MYLVIRERCPSPQMTHKEGRRKHLKSPNNIQLLSPPQLEKKKDRIPRMRARIKFWWSLKGLLHHIKAYGI